MSEAPMTKNIWDGEMRKWHKTRSVQGGAPGLGKQNSKSFDKNKLADDSFPRSSDEGSRRDRDEGDTVRMIDAMLQNAKYLTESQLTWVKELDDSIAARDGEATPRQAEVIENIYKEYRKRGGPAVSE